MGTKKGSIPWNKGLKGSQVAWNKGKKCPQISKGLKGIKRTEAQKINMKSVFIKGFTPWNKGKKGVMPEPWNKGIPNYANRGEKCHLWKGGITEKNHKIRDSIEMVEWRRNCFSRDNFTCNRCGQNGGYIECHHINNFSEFPELRFEITNGITLCKLCHRMFHNTYGYKNNTKEQLGEFIYNQ